MAWQKRKQDMAESGRTMVRPGNCVCPEPRVSISLPPTIGFSRTVDTRLWSSH